jgi:hypothetical protein
MCPTCAETEHSRVASFPDSIGESRMRQYHPDGPELFFGGNGWGGFGYFECSPILVGEYIDNKQIIPHVPIVDNRSMAIRIQYWRPCEK